jgi:hypothetical protein
VIHVEHREGLIQTGVGARFKKSVSPAVHANKRKVSVIAVFITEFLIRSLTTLRRR